MTFLFDHVFSLGDHLFSHLPKLICRNQNTDGEERVVLGEQFLQEMRKVIDEIVNFLTRCRYFDEFVLQDSDIQILIFQCQVRVVQTLFQTFEHLTLTFW